MSITLNLCLGNWHAENVLSLCKATFYRGVSVPILSWFPSFWTPQNVPFLVYSSNFWCFYTSFGYPLFVKRPPLPLVLIKMKKSYNCYVFLSNSHHHHSRRWRIRRGIWYEWFWGKFHVVCVVKRGIRFRGGRGQRKVSKQAGLRGENVISDQTNAKWKNICTKCTFCEHSMRDATFQVLTWI